MKMTMSVRYSPLPTDIESPQPKQSKFAFPKITRLKLIALGFILSVSVVIVLFTCFKKDIFSRTSICNLTQGDSLGSHPETQSHKFSYNGINGMKRRLPQSIIIGARKAGSRALLTYLNIHPDIVTKSDEMHFFDVDSLYEEGLEVYRKKMPPSYDGQLTIEKTPAYFTEVEVPERVYRMNNSIKLFLILRDPVERALSDYLQISENARAKNKPVLSFEQHCLDHTGKINKSYKAISRSVYHRHLSRWLELFDLEQIHIIDSYDLVHAPAKVMWEAEEFLGIDHMIKPSHFYFNKTKGFYCIKTDITQKCLTESKGRIHPEIDGEVLHKLREYFRPHNEKLYRLIGRSFNWIDE